MKNLVIIFIILLPVFVFSISCDFTHKETGNGHENESAVDIGETPPESNNYQGLRFETINLEFSKIDNSFPRLVCLGDSVTFGWNIAFEKSYPSLLEGKLKEQYTEVMVINSGIGGQSVVDGLDRLDSDLFYFDPQLAIISFGLNDAFIVVEEDSQDTDLKNNIDIDIFTNTYRRLIDEILKKDIEIVVMNTNPVMSELLWEENKDIAQKQEESYRFYNQAVKEVAEEYGLIFVDIWENFKNKDTLDMLIQPDGLHPTENGLVLISELLYTYLGSIDLVEQSKI